MNVCLLTSREVYCLEERRAIPVCEDHRHISVQDAAEGIALDLLRIVGDGRGGEVLLERPSVTEQLSNNRTWKSRLSDGVKTRQLVRIVQG